MNGCSIDYQLYSTVNMHCSKCAWVVVGWVGGRNLIINTISAELDCAELGNKKNFTVVGNQVRDG